MFLSGTSQRPSPSTGSIKAFGSKPESGTVCRKFPLRPPVKARGGLQSGLGLPRDTEREFEPRTSPSFRFYEIILNFPKN